MREYAFWLNRIILYNDRIVDPVLLQKNTGQRRPVLSFIVRSDISYVSENNHKNLTNFTTTAKKAAS